MRDEALLLKSRLPLQFVQWKFSIQWQKTIKLTVLNSREDTTETGPEITHTYIHSSPREVCVCHQSAAGYIHIHTDTVGSVSIRMFLMWKADLPFALRTTRIMSQSLNT